MPTSTPTGTLVQQEDLYIQGGPTLYFGGGCAYSPDSDGFYHGLVGTAETPVYEVGCYENFRFGESVTVNEVRCDNKGLAQVTQDRDYLLVQFELTSLLPLTVLRHMMKAGEVVWNDAENAEKMGIGTIDNDAFHMFYFTKVYDEDAGDFISVTLHRCQFVEAWELQAPYGAPWKLNGIRLRAFADDSKPAAQRFATTIRVDASAL